MTTASLWFIALIVIAVGLIAVWAHFYERATNEVSLVKTGIGGRRIILDGGTLVLPYFHQIARVNMQTLRLEARRAGDSALITGDRLRVDVSAQFYISVVPEPEAVARAAQTLGNRMFQPEKLADLIDGMMVDAMRAAAAGMTMDELHDDRDRFVRAMRTALGAALGGYGLQLDAVSLTTLDQTPFSALDENNAFNAVGMRKLAEVIATSKKERAEIDADAEVSVARAAMEAERRKLEIELEQRRARIAQQLEIETLSASQLMEIAQAKAAAERETAQARIQMEQEIEIAEFARDRIVKERDIENQLHLTMAEQDRQIHLARKSQEESRAAADADLARADAVGAAEAIATARRLAEAERERAVSLVQARRDAEAAAATTAITAKADRDAADDRAEAARSDIDTRHHDRMARIAARRAEVDALNLRSEAATAAELELARLEALPQIVAEMVKPAEKINAININHLSGSGERATGGGDKPPINQALDSLLDMAVQLPALKKFGETVGVNFDVGLSGLTDPPADRGQGRD